MYPCFPGTGCVGIRTSTFRPLKYFGMALIAPQCGKSCVHNPSFTKTSGLKRLVQDNRGSRENMESASCFLFPDPLKTAMISSSRRFSRKAALKSRRAFSEVVSSLSKTFDWFNASSDPSRIMLSFLVTAFPSVDIAATSARRNASFLSTAACFPPMNRYARTLMFSKCLCHPYFPYSLSENMYSLYVFLALPSCSFRTFAFAFHRPQL
mmetsp:Transcript_17207/g.42206  ORF Transcript_17207/g.42206 Transcript_17207/m.42206 type:complete len:209 (+) Transcript_17207:107-733(+)